MIAVKNIENFVLGRVPCCLFGEVNWGLGILPVLRKGVIIMKRILGGLIFVFVFGAAGLCADPPGQVDIVPLVDFEGVIDDVRQFFTDVLKEQWVLLLSIFSIWLVLNVAKAMLDGRFGRIKAEVDRQERIQAAVVRAEEKQETTRLVRQRERERSRYVEQFEADYRSRELDSFSRNLGVGEKLTEIDGRYYASSESHGYVNYRFLGSSERVGISFEQRRAEFESAQEQVNADLSEPLSFDNDDYGRVYDSVVDEDYQGHVLESDAYMPNFLDPVREQSEELGFEPELLPFEDAEYEWSQVNYELEEGHRKGVFLGSFGFRRRKSEYLSSGLDDDEFEREYRERQSSFRGGY